MANTPTQTESIRAEYARREATARRHTPFGVLTDLDRASIPKRTAQACGVTIDTVKAVCDG